MVTVEPIREILDLAKLSDASVARMMYALEKELCQMTVGFLYSWSVYPFILSGLTSGSADSLDLVQATWPTVRTSTAAGRALFDSRWQSSPTEERCSPCSPCSPPCCANVTQLDASRWKIEAFSHVNDVVQSNR